MEVKNRAGRDGVLRAARLRPGKHHLERAVQHLYPLELLCDVSKPKTKIVDLNPYSRYSVSRIFFFTTLKIHTKTWFFMVFIRHSNHSLRTGSSRQLSSPSQYSQIIFSHTFVLTVSCQSTVTRLIVLPYFIILLKKLISVDR